LAYKIYGSEEIHERHRHRYEINISYLEQFEKHGLHFTGCDLEKERMEVNINFIFFKDNLNFVAKIFELKDHPFYFGVQFHPEFKTRIFDPAPVFLAFLLSSAGSLQNR